MPSPSYDRTVFQVPWGNLALKTCDQGGRGLRVEVVMHKAKDLRCGKGLDKLPGRLERMSGRLVRFLNTGPVAPVGFLDQGGLRAMGATHDAGHAAMGGPGLA